MTFQLVYFLGGYRLLNASQLIFVASNIYCKVETERQTFIWQDSLKTYGSEIKSFANSARDNLIGFEQRQVEMTCSGNRKILKFGQQRAKPASDDGKGKGKKGSFRLFVLPIVPRV